LGREGTEKREEENRREGRGDGGRVRVKLNELQERDL